MALDLPPPSSYVYYVSEKDVQTYRKNKYPDYADCYYPQLYPNSEETYCFYLFPMDIAKEVIKMDIRDKSRRKRALKCIDKAIEYINKAISISLDDYMDDIDE